MNKVLSIGFVGFCFSTGYNDEYKSKGTSFQNQYVPKSTTFSADLYNPQRTSFQNKYTPRQTDYLKESYLLCENGSYLLQENGGRLILEPPVENDMYTARGTGFQNKYQPPCQ